MRSNPSLACLAACIIALAAGSGSAAQAAPDSRFSVEVETGAVWQSRNEIHIPHNAQGTRFAMTDVQGSGPEAQRRIELTWQMTRRHSVRFVYAPLNFSGSGTFAAPVRFAGGTYASGIAVDSDYKFDFDRLTYRYLIHESERWKWRIGATAFVRDARVELRQPGSATSDSNVGVVPLLSASMEYAITPLWTRWSTSTASSVRKDERSMPPSKSAMI